MARFFGAVQGGRGAATRLGTASSGVQAQAQGWDVGAKLYACVDADGNDVIRVYATGGSNGPMMDRYLGTVQNIGGRLAFVSE